MAITTATTATSATFSAPRQLSDQNSQGSELGVSATDLVGFYGVTPIAQQVLGPSTVLSAALYDAGQLTKYQATLTTASVAATTTAETTSAVAGVLVGDVIAINKPAAQAGLGVVGYRQNGTAGQIGVTYSNVSSGAITPTSTDAYDVIGVSSNLTTTAALTPASVPSSTFGNEQLFSVPGATVGAFPIVNKPTAQAGLGISNIRVTANGQVGLTFVNNSSGAITPTAAETYSFAFLPSLQASDRTLIYKFAAATSAIAATTTTDVSSTITGLLSSDVIAGVSKPSYQAGIGVVGYRVSAANTAYITYVSQSSGAITSTAEAYSYTVLRQQNKGPFVVTTQTLTPVSVAANTTAEQTFTVNSLAVSTSALVSKPSYTQGLHVVGSRVSAASTLAITYQNNSAAAIVPPAEVYTIASVPLQGPGAVTTAGTTTNSITVGVVPDVGAAVQLRQALINLGLIASS